MNKKVAKAFAKNKFYQVGVKIQINRLIPIYWDPKAVLSDPYVLKIVAKEISKLIKNIYPKIEVIAGGATGAISLAAATALELKLPWVYIRNKPKEYSTKKMVEGSYKKGARAVLLDDVIATGNAKKIFLDNSINELDIKNIIVLLDDASGSHPSWLTDNGITVHSLFKKSERDDYYKQKGFFGPKVYELEKLYAADRDNWHKDPENMELFNQVKNHFLKNKNLQI